MMKTSFFVLFAILCGILPLVVGSQSVFRSDYPPLPYLPTATSAQQAYASNLRQDSLFPEPNAMLFTVFGFASDDEAIAAFDVVVDYYFDQAEDIRSPDSKPDDFVSVGRLGDDRAALLSESDVRVFVRIGPNILYVWSFAFEGDTVGFVADYLSGFLEGAGNEPDSMMPAIFDLPIGWELERNEPFDVLDDVTTAPTPTPIPTLVPTPTVAPTPLPREPDDPVSFILIFRLGGLYVNSSLGNGSCQGDGIFRGFERGEFLIVTSRQSSTAVALDEIRIPSGRLLEDGRCEFVFEVGPLDVREEYYLFVGGRSWGPFSFEDVISLDGPLVLEFER